jgi:Rhs element Vgr protein
MTVVTTTILDKADKPMTSTYELMSVDIERTVNRVPRCSLKLIDGDVTKGTFPISDEALFALGAEITIKMRYEKEADAVVFKGVVVRHGLEVSRAGSILNIELRDKAVALTQPRKSIVHKDETDAQVISKLAKAAGLGEGKVETTKPKHTELVQYHATDWDFMLSRAEVHGLAVSVTDGALSLSKLAPAGAAAHTFELGKDEIFSVDLEADGLQQVTAVEGDACDLAEKAASAAAVAAPAKNPLGNLDGAAVAKALGFKDTTLSHPAPVAVDELKAWVDGRLAHSRMSMVRGRIATRGAAKYKLLEVIKLVHMGARFNGESVITGVRHRVNVRGWQTDLQFGFSPDLFCHQPQVTEVPAAGLLPAVSGLQIGVVAAFEKDPLKALRVKVILPGIDPKAGAVWARLATPDAGTNRGYLFRPEPGDEVVVGFFNSDPRQPVILGGMFGAKNTVSADIGDPTDKNLLKGIISKKGVKLLISDGDKPNISIETPGKNKLILDDDGELVEFADAAGNKITLNKNGVTIKSAKDVTIDGSGGNVVIKGKKVDVQ